MDDIILSTQNGEPVASSRDVPSALARSISTFWRLFVNF